MTKNSYMDRAERARDPRFSRILGKLGYERRDMVAAPVQRAKIVKPVEHVAHQAVDIPEGWEDLHWTQRVALAKRLQPTAPDIDARSANDIIAAAKGGG